MDNAFYVERKKIMNKELLLALTDALLDTLKVFVVVFLIYILFSFIEGKIAKKFEKQSKFSPLIGASIGLIPQCGFSIVSADLYRKKYISMGTLLAVFIACSDEALPVLLSYPDKLYILIPLLLIKFIIAVIFGYLIDFIYKKQIIHPTHQEEILVHSGCCHHEIEQEKESNLKKHFLHPLIHSLKIGVYVLIVNLLFALLIYFVGENSIKVFLNRNLYLTPVLAGLVGLIPNCASSVILTELYISSALSFGALMSGLICNAGLGLIYLFKDKKNMKNAFLMMFILYMISMISGYFILLIEHFL